MVATERGQAYVLEGLVAAILVVLALFLAMQSVVITPTTEGTADRDTMAQLDAQADDVLAGAHERGELAEAALLWDDETGAPADGWGIQDCPETADGSPLTLCRMLEESFTNRSYRYNVYVDYREDNGTDTQPLFVQGVPGSNAVTATHAVALHGGMELSGPDRQPALSELEDGEFYAPDVHPGGVLHNVIEIRVVVW